VTKVRSLIITAAACATMLIAAAPAVARTTVYTSDEGNTGGHAVFTPGQVRAPDGGGTVSGFTLTACDDDKDGHRVGAVVAIRQRGAPVLAEAVDFNGGDNGKCDTTTVEGAPPKNVIVQVYRQNKSAGGPRKDFGDNL
jgi:hypothetical protein